MALSETDILVVADLRFAGGTSAALAADVRAFSALGLNVSLLPVRSPFLDDCHDEVAPVLSPLFEIPCVSLADPAAPPPARIAFLHNPMVFVAGLRGTRPIVADQVVLVAHHPPFRGDGSLEYNPVLTTNRIRRIFGHWPRWAPVSGLVRQQLRAFAPFIAMTSVDWNNVFDSEAWCASRRAFDGIAPGDRALVGRHGRADRLKWPDTTEGVVTPLMPGPGWRACVMGLAPEALALAGMAARDWDILPFGSISPHAFLDRLDAFVYHHHPAWTEAFGRTVAEAILMERPCLLDPALRPTFGDLADYAPPTEAATILNAWRANPEPIRALASARRARAIERFGDASIEARLSAIHTDVGTRSRFGPKTASAGRTVRKAIGLARREMRRRRPWSV
jgi:hypothetical protein